MQQEADLQVSCIRLCSRLRPKRCVLAFGDAQVAALTQASWSVKNHGWLRSLPELGCLYAAI